MAGFKKGLMEFAQGFALSAGSAIATNIREKAKQDRADILNTTKELKARIARGRAADTKATNGYVTRANDLLAVMPGLADDPTTFRLALSSDNYAKQMLANAEQDQEGANTGGWYDSIAKQNKLGDGFNIYSSTQPAAPNVRKTIKGFRNDGIVFQSVAEMDKAADQGADNTLASLLGGGMRPEDILKSARRRIAGSGAFSGADVDKYGGSIDYVPKAITSTGKPVRLPSTKKRSATAIKASVGATDFTARAMDTRIRDMYKDPEKIAAASAASMDQLGSPAFNRVTQMFVNDRALSLAPRANIENAMRSKTTVNVVRDGVTVAIPIREYLRQPVNPQLLVNEAERPVLRVDYLHTWLQKQQQAALQIDSLRDSTDRTVATGGSPLGLGVKLYPRKT